MNLLEIQPEELPPPTAIEVFPPSGEAKRFVGWTGVRLQNQVVELFLVREDGILKVLNKKVVIQNVETGEVIYNPREAPTHYRGIKFLDDTEVCWLQENPQWPKVLELHDNPVDNGEENDGLYA